MGPAQGYRAYGCSCYGLTRFARPPRGAQSTTVIKLSDCRFHSFTAWPGNRQTGVAAASSRRTLHRPDCTQQTLLNCLYAHIKTSFRTANLGTRGKDAKNSRYRQPAHNRHSFRHDRVNRTESLESVPIDERFVIALFLPAIAVFTAVLFLVELSGCSVEFKPLGWLGSHANNLISSKLVRCGVSADRIATHERFKDDSHDLLIHTHLPNGGSWNEGKLKRSAQKETRMSFKRRSNRNP